MLTKTQNSTAQRNQQSFASNPPANSASPITLLGDRIMATLAKARAESLLGFGVAVAATIIVAINAHADPVRVTNLGQYGSLNLRTAPSLQADVIGRLPASANSIEWTGNQSRRGSTLWYEVIYNGKIGWASSRYLEVVPNHRLTITHQPNRRHAADRGTTTTWSSHGSNVATNRISVGGQFHQLSSDDVGAAIFGLIAGGILWSILNDGAEVQPDPQPTPPPPPPRRRHLSCAADDVSFKYERATGDVELTLGRHTIRGQAEERIEANRRSFAVPFSSARGKGILIVDDISADGNNANLYWDGARRSAFHNVACRRIRQG